MQPFKILPFVFLLVPAFCLAQGSSVSDVESIAAPLIKNLRQNNTEKVFIYSDKKIYAPGESIWFKAFVVDSLNNRITYKNKTLFVDLVNDKDSVISQLLLHGDGSSTNGNIALTDSSLQGYYWLRAYTKSTLDDNIHNIGLQPVYVINGKMKNYAGNGIEQNNISATQDVKPIVEVYPEGGSLISGTTSTVGLKVHDHNGNPLMVQGVVKDNRDTVVAKFITNNSGLAKFVFSPTWFGKYKIFIQDNDKYDSVAVLPGVNRFAAQIAVEEQNEQSVKIRVMLEDSIYTTDYTTYIIGISKDSLCFAGIGRGMYELNIPLSNFPGGIAKLILFNAEKQVISERDIYINKRPVNVNVTPDKTNYSARENVKLDISVTDANGTPSLAALSIAVVDSRMADTVNNFPVDALKNLSTGDADLVMLTQKQGLQNRMKINNESDASLMTDTLLTLKGTVFNKRKEPVPGYVVMLMSNSENVFILQDTTDASGKFSFTMPDYNEGAQFNLQVSDLKGIKEDYDIALDPISFPHFATPVLLKQKFLKKSFFVTKIENQFLDSLVNNFGKEWLKPVTVTSDETNKKKKNTLSSNVITQEMLKKSGFNNVGTAVLQTGKFHLVSGYMMEGGPNGFAPSASDEPKVFMDGQEVSVSSDNIEKSPVLTFLKTVPAEQIDYIKVLSGNEAGIYGVRGGHGVIEIHTTSRATNYASATGLKTFYPKGFYVSQSFNMPDYSKREVRNSKNPDLRMTIYWNGDIITDKDGKASVNFFTADPPAIYVVTVTGITANGDKIYKTITLSRK